MSPDQRLSEVFDRGCKTGTASLDVVDRELFRIQDFILEYENGGLSGYLYNRLPDLSSLDATISAMRQFELAQLAGLLEQVVGLFRNYTDPNPPTTWGAVLQEYDPQDRISSIDDQIRSLANYGLSSSSIAQPADPVGEPAGKLFVVGQLARCGLGH